MMHMPHHLSKSLFQSWQNFKLLPGWGKCISPDGEYDDKWWHFGEISDLHWKFWWLLFGVQEQWKLIYCTFIVGFKRTSVVEKLYKHTKQHKLFIFEIHLFCNRMWIYQGVNWCSLLITHHPQPFPLVFLLRWRYSTFSLRDTVCHISGVQKPCDNGSRQRLWLESPINMPSCKTHSCKSTFSHLQV